MQTDKIKLVFTYSIALVIIVGGGAFLFLTRADTSAHDLQLGIFGLMTLAAQFVFGQEVAKAATRAAQASAASGAVTATASPPITQADVTPPGGG